LNLCIVGELDSHGGGEEGGVVVREERRPANVHGGAPAGRDDHSFVEEADEGL